MSGVLANCEILHNVNVMIQGSLVHLTCSLFYLYSLTNSCISISYPSIRAQFGAELISLASTVSD